MEQGEGSKGSQKLLEYFMAENRQLKDEIEDLRDMVKMNKVEIDVLSKNSPSNRYIEVISNYRMATENYQKKIELIDKKLEEVTSEKLVLQQLHQQSIQELKDLEELHKDRTESLQQIIRDLERKVASFQRNQKSYDSLTGFVERNKEIFNPTEQAMQFKAREEQMQEEVHLLNLQKEKGRQNEDSLLKINGILRHKVVTLQAKLAMPNKNLGQILDKSLKRLMMYFIETQKRILTGEQSDSEGEQDLQLIAPELATFFGEQNIRRQKNYNIPHLDLLKIRGSIANGNIKIKEELIKRNHLTDKERLERLEIELEYTRRELTKTIIDLREETEKRKMLQRICEELEGRNEILTMSYNKAQSKLEKYYSKIKENKEKHIKFIELDQTVNDLSTTLIRHDLNVMKKPEPVKKPVQSFDIYDSPEQYKIHLQLLAKDLSKNQKIQHLNHLKRKQEDALEQWKPRLKRSTSNPFLYFNERREDIMEVHPLQNRQQSKMRLQQTAIYGQGIHLVHGQDLDDIDI